MNYKVMDGNEACATGAYLFTEIAGIYPITPATPMSTLCDKWSSSGKLNIFNEKVLLAQKGVKLVGVTTDGVNYHKQ